MKRLLISAFISIVCALTALAQGFPRCILAGDYADPSIMRDGRDFYLTHSMFDYNPGYLIWHSRDLVNWEPVCRVATRQIHNAWAPDLLKHNGKYYLYFPSEKKIYVCIADDIRGPWSDPIEVKGAVGIDPGHVVDEQGRRYLFVHRGRMAPLNAEGTALTDTVRVVHRGWEIPSHWVTEGKYPETYLESPKLIRHNGYYYLTSAEGGTAGPATSHMVVSARARSLDGPWEESPYNPVIHTYSATDPWWSKGHGTLIDDADGNWWIVYHGYANGYHTLGRQTLLEPVEYTADGWFRSVKDQPLPQTTEKIRHGFELNDDFGSDTLGLQWTFYREYAPEAVKTGGGKMIVSGKGNTVADGRYMLITAEDKGYDVEVDLTPAKAGQAGLMLFYNDRNFSGLSLDRKHVYVYHKGQLLRKVPNRQASRPATVRLRNLGNRLTAQVWDAADGRWTTLADGLDLSEMNHNNLRGFLAVRPGLVSVGKGRNEFSRFRYRSHKPDESQMAAYLMVYHKDEDHGLHMAISRDGRQFRALNDDNPVISGDTIALQRGIRDPHIYRGPDGAFYMAMTDLNIYARREGRRESEWERPAEEYGWGNNRGIVLMKSWNLIDWTRSNLNFDELFTGWKEIGCAWAPETIYDDQTGRYMVYLTMRHRNEPNKLYYVYVSENFDKIETEPALLFQYPDESVSAIDGDITKVSDTYHLMYVCHDGTSGIKHATSRSVTGPWNFDARWVDAAPVGCEAPHVYKLIGENKWRLMYDIYRQKPMTFGFVETSDFCNFTDLGEFNNGRMRTLNFSSPKHGAIVQITAEEADSLEAYWRDNARGFQTFVPPVAPNDRNPAIEGYYADPEVLYSEQTGCYYMYPTTDGEINWNNHDAKVYSSADMKTWRYEGVAMDLATDVSWADHKLWAPCIIERRYDDGPTPTYKYFYYFVADGNIGVAVADRPEGPFRDALGRPMIPCPVDGPMRGHIIDPDVFHDPVSGKYYLYWGNAFLAVAELDDSMLSLKEGTTRFVIPRDKQKAYRYGEGAYVFYRKGKYYFMWSENDTRSPEYRVRYAMGDSPLSIDTPVSETIVLKKSPEKQIYGTGHHSVICRPGTDEWYIVYHRFQRPDGLKRGWDAGYYREVCIDRMYFNEDGTIRPVDPTL